MTTQHNADTIEQAVNALLTDRDHERLCLCDHWPERCVSGHTRGKLAPLATRDVIDALTTLGYLPQPDETDEEPATLVRFPRDWVEQLASVVDEYATGAAELIESWVVPQTPRGDWVTEDPWAPADGDALVWVAVDADDPDHILTVPLATRAEAQRWLAGEEAYDDSVDGRVVTMTVRDYRAKAPNAAELETSLAAAARGFQPSEGDQA